MWMYLKQSGLSHSSLFFKGNVCPKLDSTISFLRRQPTYSQPWHECNVSWPISMFISAQSWLSAPTHYTTTYLIIIITNLQNCSNTIVLFFCRLPDLQVQKSTVLYNMKYAFHAILISSHTPINVNVQKLRDPS